MAGVKVVILNWNGMEHLKKFLPSVIAATPDDIGIVVADNGSDDGSPGMLAESFPTVEVIRLDNNYGFAKGYNLALAGLEADCFILLNSDVETTTGWCEPLVAALEANHELIAVSPKIRSYRQKEYFEYAGAAGGFIDIFGYPFCRGRILSKVEKDDGQYDEARHVFWASGACMACRKELFTEIGGFDEDFFAHMEEIDLCWRAQSHGYKIGVEPRSVVFHLGGGTLPNHSPRKIYLNYRNSLAMLYKNLPVRRFIPVFAVRVIFDFLSSTVYLLKGQYGFFKSVYRAHRDFYRWRKNGLSQKRAKILSSATTKPEGVYRGSVVLRYFFGKRTFGNLL